MQRLLELTSVLEGFSMAHPERLALGVLAAVVLCVLAWQRGPWRIQVPGRPRLEGEPESEAEDGLHSERRDVAWIAALAARVGVLTLICVAAAKPALRLPELPATGTGIDLVVALDASGSMEALDGELEGDRVTRLELAKRAVATLIEQRPGDRIGLVVFGDRAFTQCPLTLDHRVVLQALARVEVGVAGDSTAIGDAVGLAVRRLRADGARPEARRVLVLLTDGRHNAGEIPPATAARIAAREGVRAHAVGIGSSGAVPFASRRSDEPLRFERVDLDRDTLERLASATGGQYFAAAKPEDLVEVARAIHQLEGVPVVEEPRFRYASLTPWALLAALVLLAIDALLQFAWLRRLP